MKGLVVGAGPAGLLSAWALRTAQWDVTIVDRDCGFYPGRIFSLQYLHDPCGLDSVRSFDLEYVVMGEDCALEASSNEEEYQEAVAQFYNLKLGRPIDSENSTQFLWRSPVKVWSLKDAYRSLWQIFKNKMLIHQMSWDRIVDKTAMYDVVVSTVPLDKLLPAMTWPVRVGRIAMDWVPSYLEREDDVCLYNVDSEVPWYRATVMDGGKATEFVKDPDSAWLEQNGVPSLHPLRKVDSGASLPQLPANLLLTGRWGSWDPAKLTHHAYQDTLEFVSR